MKTRRLNLDDAPRCYEIVRSLPHFFGVESAVAACAEAIRTQRGWVIETDGAVQGFLTIGYPLPSAPEVTWMAVHAEYRRRGLGRALVETVVAELADEGAEVLSVLTAAATSACAAGTDIYAGTRWFFRHAGFLAIREMLPPGWDNPALLLARPLRPAGSSEPSA